VVRSSFDLVFAHETFSPSDAGADVFVARRLHLYVLANTCRSQRQSRFGATRAVRVTQVRRWTSALKVVVVGGGAIGTCVALTLSHQEVDVVLVEQSQRSAAAAALAAAGMIAPRCEFGADHPLAALGDLSYRAHVELGRALRERVGESVGFLPIGALQVAFSEREAQALRTKVAQASRHRGQWLEATDVRQLSAALSHELLGAGFFADDGALEPQRFFAGIDTLLSDNQVERVTGQALGLLSTTSNAHALRLPDTVIEADAFVLCAGSYGAMLQQVPSLLKSVTPVRGQMVEWSIASVLPHVVQASEVYAVPRSDGRLVAGSTFELAEYDNVTTEDGVESVTRRASALIPQLARQRPQRWWSGLRPAFADGLPVIDRCGCENVVVATGHFRNGILLAPGTAQLAVDLLFNRSSEVPRETFRADRQLEPVRSTEGLGVN
jgi:glycine oxidase